MKLILLFILALIFGCGEDVEIYDTTCPNMVDGEWVGEIQLNKQAQSIAYWSCVNDDCTYHESYNVRAKLVSSKKVKVCCGVVEARVDMVRLVITE